MTAMFRENDGQPWAGMATDWDGLVDNARRFREERDQCCSPVALAMREPGHLRAISMH